MKDQSIGSLGALQFLSALQGCVLRLKELSVPPIGNAVLKVHEPHI